MSIGDVIEDENVYAPYLNKGENNEWYVEWLLLDEVANFVDTAYNFADKDIDVAINKAYKWYNNCYLKDEGMEGYIKK